ncbi:MAG TPA: phosphoribosylglycinamide formyltransferase [Lysobacter sp.]
MRLAVLASGRGSNLQAILDAIGDGVLDARVVGVFSDRSKALALQRARDAGIPATALRPADFASREAFDTALFEAIAAARPDLVVCAGYMRLLGGVQVEAWHGRMINIHPSLLPLFKGLRTHEQALAAGALEHGASVHFVTAELDGGPVVAQARVAVMPGDDAASLAARVLDREHPLLLATLQLMAARRLRLDGASVEFDGRPLRQPLQLAGMDLVEIE